MIKKDIFNTWMKEFCSLVFVQSVQALTLALILSVVVGVLSDKPITQQDQISAVGVLAIVALAAISKLEILVKKIFGLDSGITDTSSKGGMKSLVGGVLAAKMASRTLNNIPKIAGGIKDATVGAAYDKRKAQIKVGNAIRQQGNVAKNSNSSNVNSNNTSSNDPALNAARERLDEVIAEGFGEGDREYDKALNNYNRRSNNARNTTLNNTNNDTRISNMNRLNEAAQKYQDEIEAVKKKRREGIKKATSGVMETIGATAGGIAGGVMGIATGGDINEIAQYTGIGMGVGDKVGKGVADIGSIDLTASIRESKEINDRLIKAANIEIEGTRRKQVRKAKKEIERMYDNIKIDAGNM